MFLVFKNVGKAVKDALKNAFDASNGARTDDASVKRNLVVLVEGNATDDVSQVKQLVSRYQAKCFLSIIFHQAGLQDLSKIGVILSQIKLKFNMCAILMKKIVN